MARFYIRCLRSFEVYGCQLVERIMPCATVQSNDHLTKQYFPDSKVHGAYIGPTWGQLDPGGLHVGPMNFVISVVTVSHKLTKIFTVMVLFISLLHVIKLVLCFSLEVSTFTDRMLADISTEPDHQDSISQYQVRLYWYTIFHYTGKPSYNDHLMGGTSLPSGAHLGGQGPPRWAPEGRYC